MIPELKMVIDGDTSYYFSQDMINDGLSIKEDTAVYGESEVETWVTIDFINSVSGIDLDFASYTLYSGDLLAPIQVRRIISDIYDLYTKYGITSFIQQIDELSVSKISSSMQSNPNHADGVRARIEDSFAFIKENI